MLLALVGAACQWRIGFNNDNAWLLYLASRMLDGARLYRDLIEINPPLVIWLDLPVVWTARILQVDAVTVFRASLLIATLAVAWVCERLAARPFTRLPDGAVFFLCILVLLAVPVAWFGQREHLLMLFLLPWIWLSAGRLGGAEPAAGLLAVSTVGVLAGLGLAIKPHFLPVWLGILGAGRLRGRMLWRQPENLAVIVTGASYLAAVLLITPEYPALVRMLGETYARYRTQPWHYLLAGGFEPLVAWVAAGGYLVYRSAVAQRALADVLAMATVGCLLGAALQGKGFDYHYYPALAAALLLGGVMGLSAAPMRGGSAARARIFGLAILTISALPYVAAGVRIGLGGEHGELTAYRELEQAAEPVHGRRLLVLAPRSGYAFGLVTYAGARWVGRFPCLWVPPVLYRRELASGGVERFRTGEQMGSVERWFRAAVVEDALRGDPDIILVGVPTPGAGPDDYRFDFLSYLSADPEFAAFMGEYVESGRAVGYVIYRRRTRA